MMVMVMMAGGGAGGGGSDGSDLSGLDRTNRFIMEQWRQVLSGGGQIVIKCDGEKEVCKPFTFCPRCVWACYIAAFVLRPRLPGCLVACCCRCDVQ